MSVTKSPECIAPSAFDHIERQQSAKVGIFNLISTMIGGGVLSLPYAIARSGLVLGFMLLTLSAMTSVFSFDILVSSARRTGSMTYEQIGYFAFGSKIQYIITFLICCLTCLASIGYCILVGDLIKPIICYIGGISQIDCGSEWLRRIVIAFGILCVAPFCFKRQIKALKYTSILSIAAVIILSAIITTKTAEHFGTRHEIYYINDQGYNIAYWMSTDIHLFPQSFTDIIYVFPVFFLSFMCHFNIPQVHSELTRPTRKRMRIILITVVLSCYMLYSIVAFFGYFYSFGYTCGNILLNYDQNDPIINIARLSLGFVILFTFPLLILPARSALHNLLNTVFTFKNMNIADEDIDFNNISELSKSYTTSMSPTDISIPHKKGIFDESDSDSDINFNDLKGETNMILNQSLIAAPAPQSVHSHISYALFGNNNNNNSEIPRVNDKVKHNKGNEDIMNGKMSTLQVVNKLTPPIQPVLITPKTPNEYSRSTHSLLSNQPMSLTYNTFHSSTINNKFIHKKPKIYATSNPMKSKSTTNLLLGMFKNKSKSKEDNEVEYSRGTERSISTTRGFTTRSFSHLNSPLRGPDDALGVINEPKDIESLRQKDFTKTFKNLENVQNFRPTNVWLIGETTILISFCLLVSFLTESVMVLWGIVGSTVTFIIAFTLPGLFYFKIRYGRKGWTLRNIMSIIIVFVSCIAIITCTWQAMMRLDAEPCPNQP